VYGRFIVVRLSRFLVLCIGLLFVLYTRITVLSIPVDIVYVIDVGYCDVVVVNRRVIKMVGGLK